MEFVIDHRIRDWVFMPILYVMFMMGLLRIFLSKMMQNKNKETTKSQKTVDENRNKAIYLYLLTPQGIAKKTKLTISFMKRKLNSVAIPQLKRRLFTQLMVIHNWLFGMLRAQRRNSV